MTGTNHFCSRQAAINYYKSQGFDKTEVNRKIKDREIIIGRPSNPDLSDSDITMDNQGRYWIK